MSNGEIEIRETAVGTLSGHLVGVSNIWERAFPDEKGVVTMRISARLSIQDIATEQLRYQVVCQGSEVALGSDRYNVEIVEEGTSAPGKISLRRLAP